MKKRLPILLFASLLVARATENYRRVQNRLLSTVIVVGCCIFSTAHAYGQFFAVSYNRQNRSVNIENDIQLRSKGVSSNMIDITLADGGENRPLYGKAVGCSQYSIFTNDENANIVVYTTLSGDFLETWCCLEEFPKPRLDEFELVFTINIEVDRLDRIFGRIDYYPDRVWKNIDVDKTDFLFFSPLDWTKDLDKWNNIGDIVAWFYLRGYTTDEIIDALNDYICAYNAEKNGNDDESVFVNMQVEYFKTILPFVGRELRENELIQIAETLNLIYDNSHHKLSASIEKHR